MCLSTAIPGAVDLKPGTPFNSPLNYLIQPIWPVASLLSTGCIRTAKLTKGLQLVILFIPLMHKACLWLASIYQNTVISRQVCLSYALAILVWMDSLKVQRSTQNLESRPRGNYKQSSDFSIAMRLCPVWNYLEDTLNSCWIQAG